MPKQSPAGSLTILRCVGRGKRATKFWRQVAGIERPVKTDFNAGMWFRAERRHLSGITELANLLAALERDSRAFIIRGEPLPDIDLNQPVRRKKQADKAGRCWFRAVSGGLHWVLLDFDKVVLPVGIDVFTDPEGAVLYLVSLLPTCFQDVTFHWQLSSSAGIGDNACLSAHVWFWFDRPVTDDELTLWVEQNNVAIDTALFRTVQPHYTAAPLFTGMPDPLPRRSGLWQAKSRSV